MATRRQEKVARLIKETVSDAIANHLSDPRIEGFISVTRVQMSADLRNSDVYISIFGKDETSQNKTYKAIEHAKARIQSLLAKKIRSKFCPVLRIHKDEQFKKEIETMNIIQKAADELKKKESVDEK